MAHPAKAEKTAWWKNNETPPNQGPRRKKPNGEIDHVVMEAHHRYHLIIIPRRWT